MFAGGFVFLGGVIVADSTASPVHEIVPSFHQAGEVAEEFHSFCFVNVGHGVSSSVAGRVRTACGGRGRIGDHVNISVAVKPVMFRP